MDEERPDAIARRTSGGTPGGPFFVVGTRGLAMVEELAARGVSETTIAKALSMGKDAFRGAKRRDPAVQEALDRGRAIEHDRLVGKLFDTAMEGNVVAGIFLLKARHGYREGEPVEGGSNNVQVNINLPAALSPEEYRRAVDVTSDNES